MTSGGHALRTFDVKCAAMWRFLHSEATKDFALWERDHFTTRYVRDALFAFSLLDLQQRGRQ